MWDHNLPAANSKFAANVNKCILANIHITIYEILNELDAFHGSEYKIISKQLKFHNIYAQWCPVCCWRKIKESIWKVLLKSIMLQKVSTNALYSCRTIRDHVHENKRTNLWKISVGNMGSCSLYVKVFTLWLVWFYPVKEISMLRYHSGDEKKDATETAIGRSTKFLCKST